MLDFIEYEDTSGVAYTEPERHFENEVHNIRIYCEHPGCKTYIRGKEGYNGMFTAETGQRADLRNDVWICNKHQDLWQDLKKASKLVADTMVTKTDNNMTHTLKEIIKNNDALMTHVCEGKVYYQIHVGESTYQLEIDSNAEEWKNTYIYPRFKAINLMRWIRKGMGTDTFIQIK